MNSLHNLQLRVALYARVSSEEQVEGYSLDAQLRVGRNFAKERGWIVVAEYVDEGKSARSDDIAKRPKFREMLTAAAAREFDVLIVHKLDRFSRNLTVTLKYFDELSKSGVTFMSITEQIDYTTPMGRVFLAMSGAFAQFYSDNLSQETKKGWHERREQGLYCGTLPFGAMKNTEGIPVPDRQDRKISLDGQEKMVHNYEGLKMAFGLAAQGQSDREVAIALNAGGYRTTGTHGPRPFSKDTVKDMLTNRFYIGEIPDGNGGWLKAQHKAFIEVELFEKVQEGRPLKRAPRKTINIAARTYSLSYITRCARCGDSIRMHMNSKGRARVYCSSRSKSKGCDFRGTFLDIYESQIEWYLTNFVIPDDYQKKILDAHRRLVEAYGKSQDVESQREVLETVLARLKEQYRWIHISQEEYLREYQQTETKLRQLSPVRDDEDKLKRLAHFLFSVADAWRAATQEQRNKLARTLFEEIRLDTGGKVVAVKPKAEFEPFFKLSYECHAKDIASDPEGI